MILIYTKLLLRLNDIGYFYDKTVAFKSNVLFPSRNSIKDIRSAIKFSKMLSIEQISFHSRLRIDHNVSDLLSTILKQPKIKYWMSNSSQAFGAFIHILTLSQYWPQSHFLAESINLIHKSFFFLILSFLSAETSNVNLALNGALAPIRQIITMKSPGFCMNAIVSLLRFVDDNLRILHFQATNCFRFKNQLMSFVIHSRWFRYETFQMFHLFIHLISPRWILTFRFE